MDRRGFLRLVGGSLAMAVVGGRLARAAETSKAGRPNLILLLADDMGYADPSCFGGKAVATPNLDKIAQTGLKLTSAYAASAVCTPSRAAIMTGRYPLRFDIRRHFTDNEAHLPRGVPTLPAILKQAGYATGHVGKWHLGGLHVKHTQDRAHSIPGPHEHGFDHYLCQIEEQPLRGKLMDKRQLYRQGGTCLLRDEQLVPPSDPYYNMFFTDINGTESIRLVEEFHRQGKPFFLNLWWLVPHMPYEPAPEPHWSATAAPGISEDQHCFRSMVARMDYQVGRLLAKLDELGIADNTFILFTSDNGGAYEADIGPYKGGKTDLHEGGIRIPMIVRWPGRIKAGATSDAFVHFIDLLPTLCAVAGVTPPPDAKLDGLSLLPHLTEGAPLPERGTVFWQLDLYKRLQRHYPKPQPYSTEIARDGRWKLLAMDGEPTELFDLQADPLEKTNLLEKRPEIVEKLTLQLRKWLAEPRLSPYEGAAAGRKS